MKKFDIIFAIICGLAVAWVALDFFGIYGSIFVIIFPILSIIGLYITELIGRKLLFIYQAGKFSLSGAFADVIDIKVFQLLFFLFAVAGYPLGLEAGVVPLFLTIKAISFLVAIFIKFWINKHWAFEKPQKDDIKKEAIQFFFVTIAGLALNVGSFYFFTKIIGAQFSMPIKIWTELSIIFAALTAAAWNFLGYKFIVFKK